MMNSGSYQSTVVALAGEMALFPAARSHCPTLEESTSCSSPERQVSGHVEVLTLPEKSVQQSTSLPSLLPSSTPTGSCWLCYHRQTLGTWERERDETAGIPGPGWKWWNLRGLGAGGILQSVPEVKRALHPGQLHKSTLYLNLGYLGTAVTGNLQEGKIIVIISV